MCCQPAQFNEKEEIVMFKTTFPKMTKFLATGAVAVAGLMAGVAIGGKMTKRLWKVNPDSFTWRKAGDARMWLATEVCRV